MDANEVIYPGINDRFMDEWIAFGMTELNAYLAKHARFARYCAALDGEVGSDAGQAHSPQVRRAAPDDGERTDQAKRDGERRLLSKLDRIRCSGRLPDGGDTLQGLG